MAVPWPHRLEKIVINVGLGEALTNAKVLEVTSEQLAQITGQKPIVTHARKAIAGFKIRKGDAIGLKVTLRRKRMRDFIQKLTSVVLPRVRDFRGVEPRFDAQGNFHLGIQEYSIFPEADLSQLNTVRGLQVTLVTSARSSEQARALLETLGMPFAKGR